MPSLVLGMADKAEKTFKFLVVGGGIAGVTCVEKVQKQSCGYISVCVAIICDKLSNPKVYNIGCRSIFVIILNLC